MRNKRFSLPLAAGCCLFLFACVSSSPQASASPWAEKEGYGARTGGKLVFGLKHTLFSWMNPWAEAHDPVYETPWTGFCAGIGKSVIYTAAGAVQLVTFPIPVDFPNVGLGMHIPANHQGGSKGKKNAGGEPASAETASLVPGLDSAIAADVPASEKLSAADAGKPLETLEAAEAETPETLPSEPNVPSSPKKSAPPVK